MKKLILLSFLMTIFGCKKNEENSQQENTPDIVWSKTYGGSDFDTAIDMKPTADGGYIMIGNTLSTDGDVTKNYQSNDIWVVKTDKDGNIEWQNTYGGNQPDMPEAIIQTSDGGYAFTGATWSSDGVFQSNAGQYDVFLIKTDAQGNVQWAVTYGGNKDDYGMDVVETDTGDFLVVGSTNSDSGYITSIYGDEDYILLNINSQGNINFRSFGGSSGRDIFRSITKAGQGKYYITGESTSSDLQGHYNNTSSDIMLGVYTESTQTISIYCIGKENDETGSSVSVNQNGHPVILGYTTSSGFTNYHNGSDYLVLELDDYGNIIKEKCFGGNANDFTHKIFVTQDNNYLLLGEVRSNDGDVSGNHGEHDFWLVKTDSDLNILWQKTLGSSALDAGYSVCKNSDDEIAVFGYVKGNDGDVQNLHGSLDYWLCVLKE